MSYYYSKVFDKCIRCIDWQLLVHSAYKLNVDYRTHELFTKQHLANIMFYNLTGKESLNHLHDGLKSKKSLHHILKPVSLATLSNNNKNRDYRVFIPILNDLVSKTLNTIPINLRLKKFGKIKAIDATTVSFCKTYFKWAEFRKNKSGIKIHTLFNVQKQFPEEIQVINAKVHEKNIMKDLISEKSCIHLMDKSYIDYKMFDKLSENHIYFVTRLKYNAVFTEVENRPVTFSEEPFIDNYIDIFYDKEVYLGS